MTNRNPFDADLDAVGSTLRRLLGWPVVALGVISELAALTFAGAAPAAVPGMVALASGAVALLERRRGDDRMGPTLVAATAAATVAMVAQRNAISGAAVVALVAMSVAASVLFAHRWRVAFLAYVAVLASLVVVTGHPREPALDAVAVPVIAFGVLAAGSLVGRIAERLAIQGDRYRLLLDLASEAIIVMDADQRIVVFNRGAEEIFGHPANEILGERHEVLLPQRFRRAHGAQVHAFGSAGEQARLRRDRPELVGVRRNGEEFPADIRISSFEIDGETFYLAILRDLSDLREAERRERRAEDLARAKDEFVGAVSHELRTPLTAVLGLAAELAGNPGRFAEEEVAELHRLIADQATEAAGVVEDLLVAARSDFGTVSTAPRPVDLRAELMRTVAALPDHGRDRVRLEGEKAAVWADPARVRQILRNLLTNALRHGGDDIHASISARNGVVSLAVQDDGPGVSDDEAEQIFEPYYHAHQMVGQPPSVGLGLTVSRQLARLMGGDLTYDRVDGFTTFELTLPTTSRAVRSA